MSRGLLRMVKYAPFGICSRLMLMGTGDEHRGVAFHGESGRGRRSGAEVLDPSMEIGLSQTSMERAGPGYPIHVAESPSMQITNAERRAPRSGAEDVAFHPRPALAEPCTTKMWTPTLCS
jgi:hypothetical protein